jgi:hypothetical protein
VIRSDAPADVELQRERPLSQCLEEAAIRSNTEDFAVRVTYPGCVIGGTGRDPWRLADLSNRRRWGEPNET